MIFGYPITLDGIANLGMAVFGISAIYLVGKKNKWGFVVGLLSQPFFLITAIINDQKGLLILSIVYTYMWAKGIKEWFSKKPEKISKKED